MQGVEYTRARCLLALHVVCIRYKIGAIGYRDSRSLLLLAKDQGSCRDDEHHPHLRYNRHAHACLCWPTKALISAHVSGGSLDGIAARLGPLRDQGSVEIVGLMMCPDGAYTHKPAHQHISLH